MKIIFLIGAALVITGCRCTPPVLQPACTVRVDTVGKETLQLDSVMVYHYSLSAVKADSMMSALCNDGLPVAQGLEPMDYMCMDPIGPRFMVALSVDDKRIVDHGFVAGSWRVACSPHYRRYTFR